MKRPQMFTFLLKFKIQIISKLLAVLAIHILSFKKLKKRIIISSNLLKVL